MTATVPHPSVTAHPEALSAVRAPSFSLLYRGDVTVLTVAGDLDSDARTRFAEVLADTAAPRTPVIVDGTGITFCGSTCLRQLLAAEALARHRGTGFVLITQNTVVLRPLHLLGLRDHLTAAADMTGALTRLGLPW